MKHLGDNEWLGDFWLPERPDDTVAGLLCVHNHKPILILLGQLGIFSEPRIPIIHGALVAGQPFITLFDAVIDSESQPGVFNACSVDLTGQTLQASWIVYGHWLTEQSRVTHAFVHLTGLDTWAQVPPPSVEPCLEGPGKQPEVPAIALTSLEGAQLGSLRLKFRAEHTVEMGLTATKRTAQLEWVAAEPMTCEDVTENIVIPLKQFFALIRTGPAVIDRYRLRVADVAGISLEVDGWMVADSIEERRHETNAVRRTETGVEPIARWLERYKTLGRAPTTTANALAGHYPFLDGKFTTMAMASEGLHRNLHPEKRGLTRAQTNAAKRAIKAATDIDEATKEKLSSLLGGQLSQPSFRNRIAQLQDDLQPLTQFLCGPTPELQNCWSQKVVRLRNDYAHALRDEFESGLTRVLASSLTLLVAARCLVEAGYRPEQLSESFPKTRAGQNLIHYGRVYLPSLYGPINFKTSS